jgi:hypothetical protein
VLYTINIDNDGDGRADFQLGMKTITSIQNGDSFLYNFGDIADRNNINYQQNFLSARLENGIVTDTFVQFNNPPPVAPANVGTVSDPNGGYNPESTGAVSTITQDYIHTDGDVRVYVGPRQDPFYVDLERTFDLLNVGSPLYPALPSPNTNTLLGYNVLTFAIEVPVEDVTWNGMPATARTLDANGNLTNPMMANDVIAAWATTSRPRTTTRGIGGDVSSGGFVQVARLGSPLVNEVVIPVGQKDLFNRSLPQNDAQFIDYVLYPELAGLMDALLGTSAPTDVDLLPVDYSAFGSQPGVTGREDLVAAFLVGLPGLTDFPGFELGSPVPHTPSKTFDAYEALRINLTVPSGFPNGRLPEDDVVDVALSAMAGLLVDGVTVVPDGVDATGLSYLNDFPFLGDPWTGNAHPNNTNRP